MGGHGHGVHIHHNHNAFKESDEDMQGKIQRIDLIKFNPMHFHLGFFEANNWFTILGGAPTLAIGAFGSMFSYSYYSSQSRLYNEYAHQLRSIGRIFFGFSLGLAVGAWKFGDRQRLHNAYVAERLIRRYPASMELHEHNLWQCKDVKAPHEFYRWV
jgi:hypothetical protein